MRKEYTMKTMKTWSQHEVPQGPNNAWCVDIVVRHINGQRVFALCVVDWFSCSVLVETEFHKDPKSTDVVRVLDRVVSARGAPMRLYAADSLLLTQTAIVRWAADHGTKIVVPCSPFLKGRIEHVVRSATFKNLKVPGSNGQRPFR